MVLSAPIPVESGLSECVRQPSEMGCEGLDAGLALLVLGIPGLMVWLILAGSATTMIAKQRPTRSAVWLAVVWCLPIVGALCWFTYRVATRACGRTTAG
ncbi:PLDc N-terminal domain-containing protein [Mycolicibacterium frederiksbergense]|uniref:Cardiolipin synthase N-terminal domain-containing protein n=1 Tax=Mycolicibacterium frederiksbergense TaxID=117567 RepID=A0A6H0RXH2_9MYCO|nr:PLDc N-terminal domain-containing protein [Mycolicibacterium frederiksbergense]QIV79818.1 hypothetical protein EXE63_01965 [Mycolicibacterium frederiksbergense]